jgi:hypothetical protein
MQQDNRKKIGLLIIIVGLLIIIAIIYFGFFRNKAAVVETPAGPTINTNQLPSGTSSEPVIETAREDNITYDLSKEKPHKVNSGDVAKIAMAFAERLGSYSNQSSYGNFTDLKIWMTSNMKDWADTYVSELKASSTSQMGYYGITTNALTSEVKRFDDNAGVAQIIITTKRQESTGDSNSKEAYVQKLDLDFKKVNNEWLVDRAYWEK